MQSSTRILLLIGVGCTAVACATTAPRRWRGPQGQQCMEIERLSLEAEGPYDFLENGSALAEARFRPATDSLLVMASYDTAGVLGRVEAFGRPGDPPAADTIAAGLRPRFVQEGPARSVAYAMYVADGEPDLRPHRPSVHCEPNLINRRTVQEQLTFLARDPRTHNRGVVAWLFIGPDGEVVDGHLARSSGDIGIDREMIRIARQARFAPALQDGFARPVWVAIPLSIEFTPQFLRPGECPPAEVQSIPCYQ